MSLRTNTQTEATLICGPGDGEVRMLPDDCVVVTMPRLQGPYKHIYTRGNTIRDRFYYKGVSLYDTEEFKAQTGQTGKPESSAEAEADAKGESDKDGNQSLFGSWWDDEEDRSSSIDGPEGDFDLF